MGRHQYKKDLNVRYFILFWNIVNIIIQWRMSFKKPQWFTGSFLI